MHEDRFIADDLDILPADDDVGFAADKSEQPLPPVDDNGAEPGAAGIHLDVVHTAEAVAVVQIDDFLVVQFGDPADHGDTPSSLCSPYARAVRHMPLFWRENGSFSENPLILRDLLV